MFHLKLHGQKGKRFDHKRVANFLGKLCFGISLIVLNLAKIVCSLD